MKTSKKIMALSLATCLTLSPLAVSANSVNKTNEESAIEATLITEEAKKILEDYTKYEGKISEINKNGEFLSILVKDNEAEVGSGEVLHVSEKVIILNDKTQDFVDAEELKVGMDIVRYVYHITPVTLSLPPQLTPDVIVIKESEEPGTIHVSNFDEELVSMDNSLKITPSEETVIVDKAGESVAKEDLANKDLIVFYTVSTRSIPAQTTPEKIVVMDKEVVEATELENVKTEKEELAEVVEEAVKLEEAKKVQVLDKVTINENEISLDKSFYENEDGVLMMPLRQISEALGYEVTWNNESRSAELTKGAQWTSVKIGEDNYNFAKMLVKLGVAPEIKEGSTFVPFSFLEEVLRVDVEVLENGVVHIVE